MISVSSEMPSFVHLRLGLEQYFSKLDFANKSSGNLVNLQILIGVTWACGSVFVKGSQENADAPGPQATV